jgi:hypothetical protein
VSKPTSATKRRIHPQVAAARAVVGGMARRGRDPDDPDYKQAKSELEAANAASSLVDALDETAALSADQRGHIADALLRGQEQLQAWVAEQVAHFGPGDIDAGIEILRTHLHRSAKQEAAAGDGAVAQRLADLDGGAA